MSLTKDEQERLANLNYKLGCEETQPIATCQAGHDVWPGDRLHDDAGNPICECGALITSYFGVPESRLAKDGCE